MKKIKLFFALFAMLALGVGNAWAADVVCDFTTKSASGSSYTTKWSYGDFTIFGGANNSKGWAYVKMGGKQENLAQANPVYISSPEMTSAISKVQVSIIAGSLPQSGMSVNSWGVYVYSDANMTNQVDYVEGGTITKDAAVFEFTPTSGTTWSANNYYKVSFNLTNTTTKNGIIWVDKVTFVESTDDGGETPEPTPSKLSTPANLKEASITETSATLSWDAVANASNYSVTINGNTETVTTNSYSATGLTAGTEYTWSVVAKGDGTNYTDSEAAQHTFTTNAASTPDAGGESTGTATLTFDNVSKRTTFTTSQQVWTENGVTLTNDKASSTSNVADYCNPARFYKNSKITITHTSNKITQIVFDCKTSSYATALQSAIGNSAAISDDKVTVNITPATESYVINTLSGGQVQMDALTVTYETSGSGSTEPTASLTANPTSLDFGNVTQNNEVEAKTFTISGSDFTTGELTITAPSGYTVNPTTVPVDGTLEETTITVTPNTSTVGPFNGNVTISGANLKSSVTVALTMTVEKAPATPTDNVYVKVTSTEGITDGEYLIVYETGNVAFNGALETLDVASNTVEVTISDNVITGNTDIDKALFTIDATNGTVLSASGKYIGGKSSDENGINISATALANDLSIDQDGNAVIASNNKAIRYNKTAGQNRFRYFKSNGGTQEKIQLYKKASSHTVTIASCINGSVSADVASGATVLSGTTVTLENTPATGYKLAAYDVYKTDDATTKVTVTDGKFIMPEFDVTISATFELAKTLTGIEITTPATQTTFWQGETFNYEGLKVIAHFDGAADEDVTDKVTVTGSTATAGAAVEVTVSYAEGTTTKTATYQITVNAIPNTEETAYAVADAFDIIDKLITAEGVFISGIISQIDSYSDQYKSITYWISADGTTTNQLQVYGGKGLDNANFASQLDLTVGDQVIVVGNLKKYNSTYEFDANNYLASHTPTTKDPAGLAYATTSYTANVGEAFTTPELTNPHNLVVTYSTSDASKATVDANTGAVTIVAAGVVTITATTTGDATHDAGSASYNITITDPSLAVASLPFAFNGNKAAIETTAGMTQNGLGSDYSASTAPNSQLKFDGTGDWVVIRFDSEPEKLSYDIKNNSFSGGTFSVQESADGETYTDVKVHTEITNTQNEEHTLLSTSRYVKFIYTERSSGNVGLGNIKITKPDLRQEASLVWNPSTVTLTQGDAFTAPTLNNPYSVAGITYESSNDEVATVTAEGVIALATGIGTATITATFAGDATYKPAEVTCVITVNEYIETIDGEWQLVTDASKLQAGMEIIIASVEVDGKYYAMSKASDNGNNRTAVESTISGDKLNPALGTSVLTLVDAGNGTFALQAGNGNYLYAASSSSNHLKEKDEIDVNGQWTITIADNVATIKAEGSSNRNWMQFNPNNGSPLFSCYAYDKPQKDIALYAKVPDCTREIPVGYYGTVCLPSNIIKVLGATLYEVAGKEDNGRVVFDEVLAPEAGMPYIFLSHNAEVLFYCGTETATEAGKHNSLQGTFNQIDPAVDNILVGNYMVVNNVIKKCGANCGMKANRAYFIATELESLGAAPQPMPGRRRVTMGVTGENEATGVDNITENGVIAPKKLIENGQLIIIRDGVKYNVQGVRL